jgi:hypothetical protein
VSNLLSKAEWATGDKEGERSELGKSRPLLCIKANKGVRGAKVNTIEPLVRWPNVANASEI